MEVVAQSDLWAVLSEIKDNLSSHQSLIVEDLQGEDLNPDWSSLAELAKAGYLHILVIKKGSELVGYAVYVVGANMIFKDKLEANNVALFINKKESKEKAEDLIVFAEEYFKSLGVKSVEYLLQSKLLGRFLGIKGYKDTHKLWSKEL